MSTLVPPLFAGLVDDAAVFPPGSASLPEAVTDHRKHRRAWYADLVGPLIVPATAVPELARTVVGREPTRAGGEPLTVGIGGEPLTVGIVGDAGIDPLPHSVQHATDVGLRVAQVEVAVAKRGEDPQPGLGRLGKLAAGWPGLDVYAEIPLTWGLLAALDTVAATRAGGCRIAPKFRTGGLAAELFPTPVELAGVICACRDRELPFKLTAGLHNALRHTDPETGFTHHGFLNVLVAAAVAAEGGEVADVSEVLAATHPVPLIEPARARLGGRRQLLTGFGSCSIMEPLTDLIRFGLINGGSE